MSRAHSRFRHHSGGASDRSHFMTCERLSVQTRLDRVTDSSRLGVIVVVTTTESYDVLVGGVMLYPMGFQMIIGRR